ncbi:MAG TPA: hypothetical protein VLI04_04285, partial [Nocardioidaceae bacterium]|nr:hypothetical protein [Nocardioidaceae bacterium]
LTSVWSQVSGPGVVAFGNAAAVDTSASFSVAGSYVLRLSASDGQLGAQDEVTVAVSPAAPGNTAPVVNAGSDQQITLPAGAVMAATVTDDGLPTGTLTHSWTQVSGPGTATFLPSPAVEDPTVSFSVDGTYELRLEVGDGALSGSDTVTVIVNPDTGGPTNVAPTVSAGTDWEITLPGAAGLDGTVTDDGLPAPPGAVTTSWTTDSGPGAVSFVDASSVDTTATFSAAGNYVLRLTANDGALSASDTVAVVVHPAGGGVPQTLEVRVATGSDDAEQSVRSGKTALTSADLEITTDGNTVQLVGVRFVGLGIPQGATITNAYVQFRVDTVSTVATSVTIRAENADSTPTYVSVNNNLGLRALTTASVGWVPAPWQTAGASGEAQRTPDLKTLVQAVVNRSGWATGNAMAFQLSGTGMRTAESFEGGAAFAPLLHVEYTIG